MYNEALKQRFMSEYLKGESASYYRMVFSLCEKYERKYGSDVCAMSKDEIKATLDAITAVNIGSSEEDIRITYLRQYVKWCVENEVPGANDNIMYTTANVIEKSRKKLLANPSQLKAYLDELFEPEEELTAAVIYRAFLWLAYAGVKREDACKIKKTDVDLNERCIIYKGLRLSVCEEAWDTIEYAAELDFFNYVHPIYSDVITRPRVKSDTLLRGVKAELNTKTTVVKIWRTYLALHPDDTRYDFPLAYNNVWRSGWFYRIRECEKAGLPTDKLFEIMVDLQMSDTEYQKAAVVRNTKIRSQKSNYNRWKSAFRCREEGENS